MVVHAANYGIPYPKDRANRVYNVAINYMKTKIIVIGLLLLVMVIGLWALQSVSVRIQTEQQPREQSTSEIEGLVKEPQSGVGTLAELSEREGPLECSFFYRGSDLTEPIEGTFFLRNGRVRADFLQEDESLGQIVTSYVLWDEALFVWSDIQGEMYGVQVDLASESSVETPLPIPRDETVRYSCQDWVRIDDSVFEVPGTVLFKDASNASIEYGTIY